MLRTTCRIWQSHILGVLTELPTCCGSPLCAVHRYLYLWKLHINSYHVTHDAGTSSLAACTNCNHSITLWNPVHCICCGALWANLPTCARQTSISGVIGSLPTDIVCSSGTSSCHWAAKKNSPSKISQKFLLQPWCLGILIWKTVGSCNAEPETATLSKVPRSQLIDSLRKPNTRNRQHLDLPDETLLGKSESALVRSQANCAKLPKDHDQALSVYIRSVHEASSACAWLLRHCHAKSWLVGDAWYWGGQPWSCSQLCSQKCLPLSRNPPPITYSKLGANMFSVEATIALKTNKPSIGYVGWLANPSVKTSRNLAAINCSIDAWQGGHWLKHSWTPAVTGVQQTVTGVQQTNRLSRVQTGHVETAPVSSAGRFWRSCSVYGHSQWRWVRKSGLPQNSQLSGDDVSWTCHHAKLWWGQPHLQPS